MFLRLREPEVISRLWQLSQEKISLYPFISESSLVLRISNGDSEDQIIGVTGQKLILPEGEEKDVKKPPIVMIGSAVDSDIVLKSKYISRKQMIIIEDRKPDKMLKLSPVKSYNFSIVCLSSTNFTVVKHPQRLKASVGLIFFAGDVKYQILRCEKIELSD